MSKTEKETVNKNTWATRMPIRSWANQDFCHRPAPNAPLLTSAELRVKLWSLMIAPCPQLSLGMANNQNIALGPSGSRK